MGVSTEGGANMRYTRQVLPHESAGGFRDEPSCNSRGPHKANVTVKFRYKSSWDGTVTNE